MNGKTQGSPEVVRHPELCWFEGSVVVTVIASELGQQDWPVELPTL